MTELDGTHIAPASKHADRGRDRESSDEHSILLLQCCNLIVVELEAFLQLFSDDIRSALFILLSPLYGAVCKASEPFARVHAIGLVDDQGSCGGPKDPRLLC